VGIRDRTDVPFWVTRASLRVKLVAVTPMQMLSRTQADEWRIVDQLYPSLHRFSAVVAPSDLEPDDLLQEALVAVLRRHQLSALDHPAAYLRKAILSVAVSHNRTMARRRTAMARYNASATPIVLPIYPSDLTELIALPPRERAALYLHEVEGFRYAEVAEMLGCSESAAKKAGARGRRRLVKILVPEVAP